MAEKTLSEALQDCTVRCQNMQAPLTARLEAFANDVRKLSPDFADIVDRMIEHLKATGVGENAPKPGEPLPNFMMPDQNGRLQTLDDLIAKGPLVIAFHRGHWCPYCRINAQALAAIYREVKSLGAELVAITPESERFNAELTQGSRDTFPILSDMDNGYALMLNLAFLVSDEKRRAMTAAGWDFSTFQGNTHWTLPIPATFIVGQDGLVKARFIDPDYRKRMDTAEILTALKRLAN
ncbi:peroxiredoxin-like family protein [Hyphomicrobium sp.]|uniref:peroxiredoxin-like family protein n=1 Tax=Hyphomicrobium sp. TaxID=82 RepID=UPI001DC92687|nr:peroxiredoxin-like family protein [Hyphomicrobium sp.]MBY0562378.1 AhpC/TSA family protein [Hyphomicrobium sp.]